MPWLLVILIGAFILFVLDALRVQARFSLTAAGLALLTLYLLVGGLYR